MHTYVLSGLTKCRDDLIGEHEKLKARMVVISANLVHLDAVLRLFDPNHQVVPMGEVIQLGVRAKKGERSRAVLDLMREAIGPLTTVEVAQTLMVKQGHDPENKEHRRLVVKKMEASLKRQERRGLLRAIRREGQPVLWEVAG